MDTARIAAWRMHNQRLWGIPMKAAEDVVRVLRSPGSAAASPDDLAYLHAILLNGQVIGHWKHALQGREVVVEAFFYRPLDKARTRAMDAAVQRLGDYFGVAGTWR